jgi:hypothetical protein
LNDTSPAGEGGRRPKSKVYVCILALYTIVIVSDISIAFGFMDEDPRCNVPDPAILAVYRLSTDRFVADISPVTILAGLNEVV